MAYKVIFSDKARNSLNDIVTYCKNQLESAQAALSVLEDAEETGRRLSEIGASLKRRDDLGISGVYTIKFKKHKYIMVYKIFGDELWVLNIYHMSQDIKTKIQELV